MEEDDIRIEKVLGTNHHLYELVGPFVMNPEVIRLNGGYPFKNTEDHLWYISMKGKNMVTGFISVVETSSTKLCNDFTWMDYDLLERLIQEALSDMERGTKVSFMADEGDIPVLEKLGFTIEIKGVKYSKMIKIIC